MVKYQITYRSPDEALWRVDIAKDSYIGETIPVRGVAGQACVISYDGETDQPYSTIINSKAAFSVHQQGQIDILELQEADDMDFTASVYRENELYWIGYLIPDGIQQSFQSIPFTLDITATDGLVLLDKMDFKGLNNWPMQSGVSNRCPLAFIREIFFRTIYLNLPLPIRWNNSVECLAFPNEDAIAGSVVWASRAEGYTDYQGNYKTCKYVLEGILQSFGARIYQNNGKWNIDRVNDIISGVRDWKEIDTSFGPITVPILTTGTENATKLIGTGGYPFINEDQILTVKQGVSKVIATYEHNQRENILPNGGFDYPALIYWALLPSGSGATLTQYPALNGRPVQDGGGNQIGAIRVAYPTDGTEDEEIYLSLYEGGEEGLPIDSHILFKSFLFGFTFLPSKGFTFKNDTSDADSVGEIVWDSNPLQLQVRYKIETSSGLVDYYLNGYGYWQKALPEAGALGILNITQPENGEGYVAYNGQPVIGDILKLQYNTDGTNVYAYSDWTVPDNLTDYSLTNVITEYVAAITTSGASVTIQEIGSGFVNIKLHSLPTYAKNIQAAVISGGSTLLPGNRFSVKVSSMHIGDIASVQFTGKGGNNDILVPDPGDLDTLSLTNNTVGKLYIKIFIKEGMEIMFDDIYINVSENNDVYESTYSSKNTDSEEFTLNISSSFSGFMLSNYMTSFGKSNEQFNYTDGISTGSLTKIFSESVMRFRYKSSIIFNGSINVRNAVWRFGEIYNIQTLEGKNFLPINAAYNTETAIITNLVAIEGRNDNITLTTKHYGSNDQDLSN